MSIWTEPKIDCHNHIFDPARFPYSADTPYRPAGPEIGTAEDLSAVFDTYGVRHALVVGPNSGYGTDNRCLLDAIRESAGRFKGVAVVPLDIGIDALAALKAQGIVGIAFNPTALGIPYYLDTRELLGMLAELDMFLQIQTEKDQLIALLPLINSSPVKLLIDHCGRPEVEAGLQQAGFQAVLGLGRSGRAAVKLSGYIKFSGQRLPHDDAIPYVRVLVDAFTLDACVWGSDWPFLRAPHRIDYGPLLTFVEHLFPDSGDRGKLFWETPCRLFGFDAAAGSAETK